jgi:histone acetyltransferase
MEYPHLAFFHRPPPTFGLAVNPGNRHLSRIYTAPAPSMKPPDPYQGASACIVRNKVHAPPQVLMILSDVKNVVVRQLPEMGPPYITRLVYDFEAESVVVFKQGMVSAAIVSRLFLPQEFIEVVFLAVEAGLQGQGLGRLVMAFQKSVVQARSMRDILTCADNDAVAYFKKQGFNTQAIRMHPDRWIGYIKDYEGVTLVHCYLHPQIDYLRFTEKVLSAQFKFLERETGIRISEPIPEFREDFPVLPHAVVNLSIPLPSLLRRCCPSLKSPGIQGILDDYDDHSQSVKEKLMRILNGLKADVKNSSIFLKPVTEEIAPDYFDQIASPMDLSSIETRLTMFNDYYKRPEIFAIDVTLMCENAKTYNDPDTIFYHNAVDLLRRFKRLYLAEFPDADIF